jgi:putative hydrolase of the HAD superfamily
MIEHIAFDADDTLWHNEPLYTQAQQKLKRLLSRYVDIQVVDQHLYRTESRNLDYFGYGIKSFTLSMIQTAAEITSGCIDGSDILEIIHFAREMLDARIELLDGVQSVVETLAQNYHLMIITKGDLLDQQRKLHRSGLAEYFSTVEIVTDKTAHTYYTLFSSHHIDPHRFLMVGNSLRSDILPVISLGAKAVYIPYESTWAHEFEIDQLPDGPNYHQISEISELPNLVAQLSSS